MIPPFFFPEGFFERLLEHIQKAENEIFIQTYIWRADKTGKSLIDAVNEAANRGVKVYIVLDAYGSGELRKMSRVFHSKISVRYFSSLIRNRRFYIGRRLHHKIYLIDQKAWIGGMNISDDYSGWQGQTPWLDAMIQLQGNEVQEIRNICIEVMGKRKARKIGLKTVKIEACDVKILRNDWRRGLFDITRTYRKLIGDAQQELLVFGGYFMPGRKTMKLLENCVSRGVAVTLVMGKKSDVPLVNRASKFIIRSLQKRGAIVCVWNHSVVHAKLMMVDDHAVCLGSHNFNVLSDYGSLETNVLISDSMELSIIIEKIKEKVRACEKQTALVNDNFMEKTLDVFSYFFIRLALLLYVRMTEN